MKKIIKGGTIVTESAMYKADILIDGEKISAVGQNFDGIADAEVIDASGMLVLPGGVDAHVHLDLPTMGTFSSDDHYTGTKAAAFGGTTKVGQYSEYPDEFIPLDAGLVNLVTEKMPGIRKIAVASADIFVEDRNEKLRLRESGCGLCEMELAAIARVCERSGVKCLSIKCISDAFDGTGADFEKNVRNSAAKAFAAIRLVLKELA